MSTENGSFDIVMRGYDRRQVNERLRFLGAELAAAEQALGTAQDRAATAEHELERVRAQPPEEEPAPSFGERVERILRLAEEEGDEVRTRAQDEAVATRRQAQQEAQRIVAEANAVAQQRQEHAHHELQRLGTAREEVQTRLRETRRLLDGQLGGLQRDPGRAPTPGPARMDGPRRGEDT